MQGCILYNFKKMVISMELNKIYNENCLETMAKMPDNFIDLTVTSPPYDNLRDYKGYSFDFESIAKELFRVTKQGGVVVWVVGDATINGSETGTSFKQALYFKEIGFNLHDTMIWYKSNPIPSKSNRYQSSFEYMFVFSKGKPKTVNYLFDKNNSKGIVKRNNINKEIKSVRGKKIDYLCINSGRIRHNLWSYSIGMNQSANDNIAFEHPAIFPEQLATDHILSWSNENDLVYDPFGGSGTTAKMSHIWKRNWILSEISEEYCKLAEKRIAPYLAQTRLF
jgi:DNA modification methylase